MGEYVSDTPITEDGEYRVVVFDLAGNKTEINFAIDKTAPTLTLNGVNVGGITKESVTLSDVFEDAEVKVFLNDEEIEYTLGDELSEVGTYKVVVTDTCGNTTEYDDRAGSKYRDFCAYSDSCACFGWGRCVLLRSEEK